MTFKEDSHTHTHTAIVNPTQWNQLDIPIFAKSYELYSLFSCFIVLFPKTKKYTLGQRIDSLILEIIELIITAGYLPREQKLPVLQKTSIKLEVLKILIRSAWETKCLDNNKYQQLVSYLLEIGKMLGGWIKTTKTPQSI